MLYKEWEKLIKEVEKSGKSQAQWCREKNLKFKAFNYQYRKYRRDNQNEEENDKPNWIPVQFEATISSKLNIRVGNAIIEIENGYDEKLLQTVVKSLEAIC
jgi:cation transport regulator ChaB